MRLPRSASSSPTAGLSSPRTRTQRRPFTIRTPLWTGPGWCEWRCPAAQKTPSAVPSAWNNPTPCSRQPSQSAGTSSARRAFCATSTSSPPTRAGQLTRNREADTGSAVPSASSPSPAKICAQPEFTKLSPLAWERARRSVSSRGRCTRQSSRSLLLLRTQCTQCGVQTPG